jgi:hypothetical protein
MKYIKCYQLRIIGDKPDYDFNAVVAALEYFINSQLYAEIDGKKVPIRVHVFDEMRPMAPYELGHSPDELLNKKGGDKNA